jgi:hypothetical protein
MRRLFSVRSTLAKLLAGAVLLTALGGVAYAASASTFVATNDTITSCLPPNGGQLHVWKPGHQCSGGWANLTFAANGPTGATGATGGANPNATTIDGQTVTKLDVKQPTPSSSTSITTIPGAGGLTLLAECDTSGNASIDATGPASGDSELTVSGRDGTGSYGSQTATLGSSAVQIARPGTGEISLSYASNAGQVEIANIGYQSAPSFNGFAGCGFFGELTSG